MKIESSAISQLSDRTWLFSAITSVSVRFVIHQKSFDATTSDGEVLRPPQWLPCRSSWMMSCESSLLIFASIESKLNNLFSGHTAVFPSARCPGRQRAEVTGRNILECDREAGNGPCRRQRCWTRSNGLAGGRFQYLCSTLQTWTRCQP